MLPHIRRALLCHAVFFTFLLSAGVHAQAPYVSSPSISTTGSYTVTWYGNPSSSTLQERVGSGNWSTVPSNQTQSSGANHVTSRSHPNGTYHYRVYSCYYTYVNGVLQPVCGYSSTSTTDVKIPPPSPSGISVTTDTSNWRFVVNWSSVSNIDRYELEQNTESGSWSNIYSGLSWPRTVQATPGITYRFRVRACSNWSGCSSYRTSGTHSIQFDGLTLYEYDELGRLIKVIHPNNKATSYQYDDADNRTEKKIQ
jgi:YD repeat-containing protein